jgi:hypothetical protein
MMFAKTLIWYFYKWIFSLRHSPIFGISIGQFRIDPAGVYSKTQVFHITTLYNMKIFWTQKVSGLQGIILQFMEFP